MNIAITASAPPITSKQLLLQLLDTAIAKDWKDVSYPGTGISLYKNNFNNVPSVVRVIEQAQEELGLSGNHASSFDENGEGSITFSGADLDRIYGAGGYPHTTRPTWEDIRKGSPIPVLPRELNLAV